MTTSGGGPAKIVVAWDGSRASATAFPAARVIASQLGAGVEILHVVAKDAPKDAIESAVREVGLDGLADCRLRVEAGDADAEILRAVEDAEVQLVLLTTHGGAIERGRQLGRVVERVIVGASKPLVLIRPEAPLVQRQLARLLLPVDGTPKTATALRPAAELAGKLGACLDLLYIAPAAGAPPTEIGSIGAPRYVDQQQHEWPNWAAEAAERFAACCASCPPEIEVQMFFAHGDIGLEIERFAVEHDSDAIVLVRRSRLQPGRARVLRAVLGRSSLPILMCSGPEG